MFGVTQNMKMSDFSEQVLESGLPSELSNVVVESNAVVGDIWRLAVEKVKMKVVPSGYRIPKYERLFEVAKRFCVQVDGMKTDGIRNRIIGSARAVAIFVGVVSMCQCRMHIAILGWNIMLNDRSSCDRRSHCARGIQHSSYTYPVHGYRNGFSRGCGMI